MEEEEKKLVVGDRVFALDELGCLKNFRDWRVEFAQALAPKLGIKDPLGDRHLGFIRYLRDTVGETGRTPIVHRACKDNGLKLRDLEKLFPAGYHRGACVLAGLNYFDSYPEREATPEKVYRIDVRGFLVHPGEWDETFAAMRAEELGIALNEANWKIIHFLRSTHRTSGKVPTVYETCRACEIEVEDLEQLFPMGYQRGAVKVAGLSLTH